MKTMFKYECIFDHEPTDKELVLLYGDEAIENRQELMDMARTAKRPSYEALTYLFHFRGNDTLAQKYLAQIKDDLARLDIQLGMQTLA